MPVTAEGTNMGNMSYCRFQNTLEDLRDCAEALEEIGDNLAELSKEEARAASALIAVCQEIGRRFDEASVSEDTVTALCGLPDVDRLIALGDDIASNIRALKGGAA